MGFVRFIIVILLIALGIKVLQITLEDKEKAQFNACRDKGNTVVFCVTGLKI